MKKYFIVLTGITMIQFNLMAQQNKSTLFLGNSYISSNNLPELVYQLGLTTNDTLTYDSYTPGGYRFMNHAANATTMSKINSTNWDYVVLQAQSQEPSWADWQVEQEVFPYAKILCDSIRANNGCSEPLFFMTWGRENGDSYNCGNLPAVCTYEGMDSVLNQNYREMGTRNNAAVSPVGAVWHYLRDNSSIALYSGDGSHPSLAGSYAAAVTFYTLIFEKDPTLQTYNSSLNAFDADTIKDAVKTIVYNNLQNWNNDQYYISESEFDGCDSIFYNSSYYTQSVTIIDTLFGGNMYGCDSIIKANLTISNSYSAFIDSAIAQGDSILVGGNYYMLEGTYIDQQYTTMGCDSLITYYVSINSATGISRNLENEIIIYPNPMSEYIHINSLSNQLFKWNLTDISGRQLRKETHYQATKTIDFSMFEDGMYILTLQFKNGESVSKMLIKN